MSEETSAELTDTNLEKQAEKRPEPSELRQQLLTMVPTANQPKAAKNVEHLVVAQLFENLGHPNSSRFITTLPEGTTAYGLPCEFRVLDRQYQVFIPRVANWHFIRPLPRYGEHQPLAETYLTYGKPHIFREQLEKLAGISDLLDYCQDHKNDPPVIGSGEKRTPYHRFYWTGEQVIIELQSRPTAGQAVGLNNLKDRLSNIVPTKIVVKEGHGQTTLPSEEETFSELRVSATADVAYNHSLRESHVVTISPGGTLMLDRREAPKNPNIIVGFGYFYTQLEPKRTEVAEGSLTDLVIHLDFNARSHEEAKGAFALQRVASHSLAERQERENVPFSKLGVTVDDQARQMEERLTGLQPSEFELTDINEPWPFRREILEDYLPFKLNIQDIVIPCGYRAEINKESSLVVLELLVAKEELDSPQRKALLEKVVKQQAAALTRRLQSVPDNNGQWLKINRFQGKITGMAF